MNDLQITMTTTTCISTVMMTGKSKIKVSADLLSGEGSALFRRLSSYDRRDRLVLWYLVSKGTDLNHKGSIQDIITFQIPRTQRVNNGELQALRFQHCLTNSVVLA